MKIYIDSNYICHTSSASGLREFEVSFFDDKCKTVIEGYRYVPRGENWTREDGEVFSGEMISPAVNYAKLDYAQKGYDDADDTVAALMDEIEDLCNELIGE